MKLATKDKNLLIILLVAIIIVCAYTFGYKKLVAEREQIESEIKTLEKEIAIKREQSNKKDFYELMATIYNTRFNEELEKFPEDIQPENQIMFFKELEELLSSEEHAFTISNVSFTPKKSVIQFNETKKLTGQLYEGISSTITFPFNLTYEKFKVLLDFLEESKDRCVLSTISASYDEALGIVSGSVVFTQYAISEETRLLLKPDLEDMELGTDNIFASNADLDKPEDGSAELTPDKIAKRIESSFDMFLLLESTATTYPTTTMGFLKNTALLRDTKNDVQLITIKVDEYQIDDLTKPIYDENGVHMMDEKGKLLYMPLQKPVIDKETGLQAIDPETNEPIWENVYEYRATYIIGEGDQAKKIENVLIQPTEYLDLYVYCSNRVYAEETESKTVDKASVKATIINNTTKYEFINVYVVENNYMTEEEKAELEKEEAKREESGKKRREDLTVPRFVIDEEKSTKDKINLITTTSIAEYFESLEETSEELSSEESIYDVSEEISSEISEDISEDVSEAA